MAAATRLRRVHTSLVTNLEPSVFIPQLISDGVLSLYDNDTVKAEPSTRKQVECLLILLHQKRSCHSLTHLIESTEEYRELLKEVQDEKTLLIKIPDDEMVKINTCIIRRRNAIGRKLDPDKAFGTLFERGILDASDYDALHVQPHHITAKERRKKAKKMVTLVLRSRVRDAIRVFHHVLLHIFRGSAFLEKLQVENLFEEDDEKYYYSDITSSELSDGEIILQANLSTYYEDMVRDIDVKDGILDHLIASGYLSSDDGQEITRLPTRKDQIFSLINKLSPKGEPAFRAFTHILPSCGYHHLAHKMKPWYSSGSDESTKVKYNESMSSPYKDEQTMRKEPWAYHSSNDGLDVVDRTIVKELELIIIDYAMFTN